MKFLFIFLLLLISFSSTASYCLKESRYGNLKIDSTSVNSCPSGLILLDESEYKLMNQDNIIATLKGLFEFSVEDFAYFNAICLIGFISGHAIGRVSRLLGKT